MPFADEVWPEADLKSLTLALFRRMDEDTREMVLRAACQYRPMRAVLQRSGVTAIPPMVMREIARPDGWRLALLCAEMVNDDLRHALEECLEADVVSVGSLASAAATVAERWQHDSVATLWLVWLLSSCAGMPATLVAEGFLRCEDGRFSLPTMRRLHSPWGELEGPWLDDLAAGTFEHPAAELPAERLAVLLLGDLTDEHETVAWLTGLSGQHDELDEDVPPIQDEEADDEHDAPAAAEDRRGEDHQGEHRDGEQAAAEGAGGGTETDAPKISEPQPPRADTSVSVDAAELVDGLTAATGAGEAVLASLQAGGLADERDLATLNRFHEFARRVQRLTGLDSPLVDELAAALRPEDSDHQLLERLAALKAGPAATAHAERVREYALRALDDRQEPGRDSLVAFARLLDSERPPALAELFPLTGLLPEPLHAAVVAAGSGMLVLPPPPDTEAPVVPEPAQGQHGDQDVEDQDAEGQDAEEPSSDQPPDELPADTQDAAEEDAEPVVAGEEQAAEEQDGARARDEDGPSPTSVTPATSTPATSAPATASPAAAVPVSSPVGASPEPGVPAEEDEFERSGPDEDEVDELLIKLLDHRDAAAAYWVASSFDVEQARSASFELFALARQMRREGGPVGLAFDKVATELPADKLLADRTARTLAVTAGLTATFAAPYTAVSFLSLIAGSYDSLPNLHRIVEASVAAARAGVRLGAAPVADTGDERQQELDRLRQQAAELLEVGPGRTIAYQPATRIWQRWIDPRKGWLGSLLVAVRDDDRRRLDEVRAERQRLDDRELVERMATADKEERAHNSRPIEFHGREALLRRSRTHLEIVDDWLELADQQRQAAHEHGTWEERTSVELRQILASCGEAALEEIALVGDDRLAAAAAAFSGEQLRRLFDAMVKGRPLTGREPNPQLWVARPLLHLEVPLNPESWRPERPLWFEELAVLAKPPAWGTSFQRRLSRDDLYEAAAIAALVVAEDPSQDELLTDQLDEAAQAAQRKAAKRWLAVRDQVATAKRQGLLGADEAVEIDQRLLDLDLTGESSPDHKADAAVSTERTDAGQVLRELKRLERDLEQARAARIELELAELATAVENNEQLAPHAEELAEYLRAGRVAEAEELRLIYEQGRELTGPSEPEWFRPQLLASMSEPVEISDELLAEVAAGGRIGTLRYDKLGESDRERAVAALEALRDVLAADRLTSPALVRRILIRLGLDVPVDGVGAPEQSGGRHRWFDVNVIARRAPVRQFGTSMGNRVKVLVTPQAMVPSQIAELVETEAGGATTLLLHTGAVDIAWRQQLAADLRVSTARPVLPYDAHLLAARMCEPDETWAVSCALPLPYANANPYLFNVQGLTLPPEAFFGRRTELRQLLDPYGATIVFGGRQLGKTALLKQAGLAFEAYDEHSLVAIKSIKSVGIDGNPDALWGVLRAMLREAGIEVSAPATGDESGSLVADVRRWLEADERRRLLLLLDEADHFLAADAPHYSNVEVVKDLIATDAQRLKVVFAGLHDVTRFQRDANHPFVHLGEPLGIGGLDPEDALALLRVPLRALGFNASDDVLLRAVTFANYHPAILQRVGHALVERLQAAGRGTAPGWEVSADDVDAVFADTGFAEWVTGLLLNTLELDSRYGVLAYAMALADREAGVERPVARTVTQLQEECVKQEVVEFGRSDREGEIAGLLDELELLGIARKRPGGRWELRSRYVARMLGDDDLQLVNRLLEFSSTSSSYTYDASRHRRPFETDPAKVSPLVDRDIVDLCSRRSSAKAIVGSDALLIGEVAGILGQESTHRGGQMRVYPRVELGQRNGRRPPDATKNRHRVVVSDMRDKTDRQAQRAIEQAAGWRDDVRLAGTVGTAVLLGTAQLATLRTLVDPDVDVDVDVVSLQRLDAEAVRQWAALAEFEQLGDADAVIAATGGWPALVTEAASAARKRGVSVEEAAVDLAAELESRHRSEALLAACGLDQLDATARQAWEVLLSYGPVRAAELEHELASQLAGGRALETFRPTARRERLLLERLGLVASDPQTGELAAEPVAAGAWGRVRS